MGNAYRLQRPSSWLAVIGAIAGIHASAGQARAHIDLDAAGTHMSRYGENDIKERPCGRAGGARGTNIYEYKPGATIELKVKEYVSHPGYFRVSFDQDGDDDFVDPATITGEHGNCAGDPKCGAGKADYCSNDTVLLDNLDAHAGAFGTTPTYTWKVTLPNVECTNCTLQVIQVMEDLNVHFAPYPDDDIYYNCIDLVLKPDAPDTGIEPGTNNGMDCTADDPMAGAGGMEATGGVGGMAGMGTGGAAGTVGTGGMMMAGGVGGMTAGVGGMTGGTGALPAGGAGGAGAAGGTAGTGVAGMGIAGMTAGTVSMTAGMAAPPSNSESSGCRVTRGESALGTLTLLALSLLMVRRRRS